jgi:hypothetical protein
MKIVHVAQNFEPSDPKAKRRDKLAQSTWTTSKWPVLRFTPRRWFTDRIRYLPFLKDILGWAALGKPDWILLTNNDTGFSPQIFDLIAGLVQVEAQAVFRRRDFHHRLACAPSHAEIQTGQPYVGADAFLLKVPWWLETAKTFPDMVLGAEAWDACLALTMLRAGAAEDWNHLFHERHASVWEHHSNKHSLPSQLHNRKLATAYLPTIGINPRTILG